LTNLDTLRVSVAEVADHYLVVSRMKEWDIARARVHALEAANALLLINQDSSRVIVHRQSVHRARGDAWIVVALGAQVRDFGSGNKHEDPDP